MGGFEFSPILEQWTRVITRNGFHAENGEL